MTGNEDGEGGDNYGLICPFLDDDPKFARGVKFGMLYARMRNGEECTIKGYFTTDNQEQITLLCNRTGWRIVEMKPWDDHPDDWTWHHLELNHNEDHR